MSAERPLGPEVPGWAGAPAPERRIHDGAVVRLEPLEPDRHAASLFAVSHGSPKGEAVWTYLPNGPYASEDEYRKWVAWAAASTDPLFFAIVDQRSGRAIGQTSLLRIDPVMGVIETGWIWLAPELQRTRGATEMLYLLARHVFDDLGYRRFEWKCNELNAPSRRAAERFGFTYEGVFRQHMVVKGRNRDTAWYAMLDSEWPTLRTAFETWLADANFDTTGTQLRPLASFRP